MRLLDVWMGTFPCALDLYVRYQYIADQISLLISGGRLTCVHPSSSSRYDQLKRTEALKAAAADDREGWQAARHR